MLPPEFAEFTEDPTPRNLERVRSVVLACKLLNNPELEPWTRANKPAIEAARKMLQPGEWP